MMKIIELLVPKMGEGILEVNIIKWLKCEGENFNKEEPIVEIATDKVDSEIQVPYEGTIEKLLAKQGEDVEVGKPIALLKIKNDYVAENNFNDLNSLSSNFEQKNINLTENKVNKAETNLKKKYSKKEFISKLSPLVKNIALTNNLSQEDLDRIYPSGKNNQITKDDILHFLKFHNQSRINERNEGKTETKIENKKINYLLEEGDVKIELDRIRKITAKKMSHSNRTIPHVTSFVEADITDLVYWRNEIKENFKQKHKVSLTFTPLFIWAICQSLKKFPIFNSYFFEDFILQKNNINIGLAVAIDQNNLVVPVIKNADKLSITSLALRVNEIAFKAKDKSLNSDDIYGATYSLSNIGKFNTILATPMITPPQIAVMAIGTIKKTEEFYSVIGQVKSKYIIYLCHSYDHRVIDGALGSTFAADVAENLKKIPVLKEDFSFV